MKLLTLLIFLLPYQANAIELIIGGKTYYIQKFEIKDDGKTIVVPYKIYLDEAAFAESQACQAATNESPAPSRNTASSVQESGSADVQVKPNNSFNELMNDLNGQFNSLTKQLRQKPTKKRYKRDFR